MELFRSETMQLVQLIVPAEAARDTVAQLGDLGLVQFRDLNPDRGAFQRTYANQVKRTDEMLRKLRYFSEQIQKAGLIPVPRAGGADASQGPGARRLDELESRLEALEQELRQITANTDKLRRSRAELVELQLVLEKAGGFFDEARMDANDARRSGDGFGGDGFGASGAADRIGFTGGVGLLGGAVGPSRAADLESGGVGESLLRGERAHHSPSGSHIEMYADPKAVRLGFITGVLPTHKTRGFERVAFRATRGNMFLKQSAVDGKVEDPATGEEAEKTVFVVFFAGERARTKILKICEAFGANRYPFPEDFARQRQMCSEVNARLQELQSTLDASVRRRNQALSAIGDDLDRWVACVRREKATYHTLNMFSVDVTRKALVAEGWCPARASATIREALFASNRASSAQMGTVFQPLATKEQPPTHFTTNKITEVFQGIVEAYGVGRYREVNPAVFTIVTFPFLFAVMFGDFGHGVLMLLAAVYMVAKEKELKKSQLNEIVQMGFEGRYVILLMAVFSIYTGLLYNECFSVPMNLFGGSAWRCDPEDPTAKNASSACASAYTAGLVQPGAPYAFGVDPIWHGTKTELPFLNSLKMKMSIVMGVTQMMLGIFMSLLNFLHTRDWLSIWCEFVPQVLFLGSLFGYLVILIILKWVTPGATADLYHVMIYMFLSPGNADCAGEGADGGPGCPENVLFYGQGGLQVFLVLIALFAVPVMLFPKPYYLKKRHEARNQGRAYAALVGDGEESEEAEEAGGGGGDFDYGEVLVHQMIHTIEFVLGAVSNTASYLRLWALSLAHAQLSAVFWDRVFMGAVATGSPVAMVVGFAVWAAATIGVLMLMESLSAFLHALRLHWVEYQNKFYRGDGYKFEPFSFKEVLAEPFE